MWTVCRENNWITPNRAIKTCSKYSGLPFLAEIIFSVGVEKIQKLRFFHEFFALTSNKSVRLFVQMYLRTPVSIYTESARGLYVRKLRIFRRDFRRSRWKVWFLIAVICYSAYCVSYSHFTKAVIKKSYIFFYKLIYEFVIELICTILPSIFSA